MKKVFVMKETAKIRKIFNETYKELKPLLKAKGIKQIVDNPELSQLHDLFVLLKAKKLKTWCGEDEENRFLALEIKTSS